MQTINPAKGNFQIAPLSDRSVLVSFGNIIDPSVNEKVLFLHKALSHHPFAGFLESVPAYASLAIFYDVVKMNNHLQLPAFAFLKNYLGQLIQRGNTINDTIPAIQKIPVCYDPVYGLDIRLVAETHRLSINELISLHTSVIYRVYMIGFLPGFAYMGTVVEKLNTPRKTQPRLQVPAGSVGIAGKQTGIYPVDSPGGWQVIGKTPVQIFNKEKPSPCLLSPGDQVQFVSIDINEFKQSNVH